MNESFDAAVVMTHASRRVARDLVGVLSYETIEREVAADYDRLAGSARVRQFIPVLVERAVRDRLRETLRYPAGEPSRLLFVCTRNAGRSQMAAAFARRHGGGRLAVRSAGSQPADTIQLEVAHAMGELGIDLSGESPARVTDALLGDADIVITMGCGDAVTVLPRTRYVDWEIDDPDRKPLEEVRGIRDEIERRVLALLHDLARRQTRLTAV